MEAKRSLRPFCVILAVLYVLNGIYIVIKRALIAMIEQYSEVSAAAFVQGCSTAELLLFTVGIGICLLCAVFLTRGRLRAALFVLTAAQVVMAFGNLLSPLFEEHSMAFSLGIMLASACCTIVGYGLLTHSGQSADLRVIGWLCAAVTGASQLCAAFSALSAMMMGGQAYALWFQLFWRSALISSVLSIIANILQALYFVLLLFAVQRLSAAESPVPVGQDCERPASTEVSPTASSNTSAEQESSDVQAALPEQNK